MLILYDRKGKKKFCVFLFSGENCVGFNDGKEIWFL